MTPATPAPGESRDPTAQANLSYGRRYTDGDPLIEAAREVLDRETKGRAEDAGQTS